MAGCIPIGSGSGDIGSADLTPPGHIVVAVAGEPRTLLPSVGSEGIGPADHLFDIVHQSLVTYDAMGQPVPRIARALPSLSDGTWRLMADGTMETRFQLREGVRWHDGRPLTVEDVIFSWRLFNSSAVPVVSRRAARLIDAMESPDQLTVVVHWRSRYAFANQLSGFDLTILPAHLLEASFELRPQQMAGHPYWQAAFVGLGPYRLARWIAGSSLELEPIADYFLGVPKAEHVSVRFIPDDSSAMAAALGGRIDVVLPRRAALGIIQGARQQWRDSGAGSLFMIPTSSWGYLAPQFASPQPPELADPRIRRALAYAIDRRTVAEAVAGDGSLGSDLWVAPTDRRFRTIAAGVARYEYSAERALAAFRDAGWRREGTDGVLVNHGERFEMELLVTSDWYPAAALVADYWRQSGVMVKENVVTLASSFDRQARSTHSGMELAGSPPGVPLLESRLRSTNAPAGENLFVGSNRGHYASREMDSLLDRVWQAIDPPELDAAENDIARLVAEDLPILGVYFHPSMALVRADIDGVRAPETAPPVARPMFAWNAHEWQKR